jgi:hypothetical protein
MNLLQKLKPHYKAKLDKFNNEYPEIVGDITTDLENENYLGNLRYATIVQMSFVFGTLDAFKFFDGYDS